MNLAAVIAVILMTAAVPAVADDKPPPGLRTIGGQTYVLDGNGHTTGTIREVSPGVWQIKDKRGVTVRTIQVPPGCPPFGVCPAKR